VADLAFRQNREAINWLQSNLPGIRERNPGYVDCLLDVLLVADTTSATVETYDRAKRLLKAHPELLQDLRRVQKDPAAAPPAGGILYSYGLITPWPGPIGRWHLTPLGESLAG
jgi:hypothetical protein